MSNLYGDVITLRKVNVAFDLDHDTVHIPNPTGSEEIVAVHKGAGRWVSVILARHRRAIPVDDDGLPLS